MKNRSSFVSNSSSSSFVVACDKNKKGTIELRVTIELDDFVSHVIHDEKELEEYIMNEFGEDRCGRKPYDEYLELLKEGKVLHIGSVSSDADSATEQFLYQNGIEPFLDGGDGEVVREG